MAEDTILEQSNPIAATLTDLYTVPANKRAVIAGVNVANRTASDVDFRISIAKAGAADSLEQYTHYDVAAPGKDTYFSPPATMATTDVLRVYAATQDLSFTVFGVEIDV